MALWWIGGTIDHAPLAVSPTMVLTLSMAWYHRSMMDSTQHALWQDREISVHGALACCFLCSYTTHRRPIIFLTWMFQWWLISAIGRLSPQMIMGNYAELSRISFDRKVQGKDVFQWKIQLLYLCYTSSAKGTPEWLKWRSSLIFCLSVFFS